MVGWLLDKSNSSTSLGAFVLGSAAMLVVASGVVSGPRIGAFLVTVVIVAGVLELLFDVYDGAVRLLGRDPTLTDRTILWQDVLDLQDSVLLGAGFESFWLGARLDFLWSKWSWQPNQAHNGYLETYLNLGAVGLALLFAMLLSTFRKIAKRMTNDVDIACLRLGFLIAIVAYNYTEATFKGVSIIWAMFCIVAIAYPQLRKPKQMAVAASEKA